MKRLRASLIQAGLRVAIACIACCAIQAVLAQGIPPLPSVQYPERKHKFTDKLPEKPSLPPFLSIPVQPLGFSASGSFYVGRQNSLASLDFLDENRLLFTFQAPGLMNRDPEEGSGTEERQIRAVVLGLPEGKVEAETSWTLHDRARYLWMLKDGHFLLRDRDDLEEGDAQLKMRPSLRFPGRLLWLEIDPSQKLMDTNFLEPATAAQKPDAGDGTSPAESASAAPAQMNDAKPDASTKPHLIVRTVKRDSGQVVLENRVALTIPVRTSSDGYTEVEAAMLSGLFQHVQLPINTDGYLQALRAGGNQWNLSMKYFAGGSKVLGQVESTCSPASEFISEQELVVTACALSGGWQMVAIGASGSRRWEVRTSSHETLPRLVWSANGSRLGRETMVLNYAVDDHTHPLNAEAVKGQVLRLFDASDGKLTLEMAVSPALDAGGNVGISPSGRRVAVLNAGSIQVFELPTSALVH